ncbi:MAG: thioredoxin family protein [Actinomycetota bacterium]|nr:thioredoxin family protein [Actinomycetota bacterium]
MHVELLYFEGCPNCPTAEARLREALAALGQRSVAVTYQVVSSPEQAERVGFRGSPTILVNGTDPFARPDDPAGFACRLYRHDDHVPTVEQMRAVLSDVR